VGLTWVGKIGKIDLTNPLPLDFDRRPNFLDQERLRERAARLNIENLHHLVFGEDVVTALDPLGENESRQKRPAPFRSYSLSDQPETGPATDRGPLRRP
jgi:hypothetical protein